MTVAILKSTYKTIKDDLPKLLELIDYKPQKKKIFIKPNIVDALPPSSAVIVHPKMIDALCEYFQSFKIEKIVIGEGTGFFTKPEHFRQVIKTTKYTRIEKKFDLEVENLQFTERVPISWKYGEIALPKYAFDDEYEYINMPKMKTHSQCSVTLSMKNQKGLISLKDKINFHKTALHDMIFELSKVVKPDLVLMDAITCIEGTGPTQNTQTRMKKMDLILAGREMLEVDNVGAQIMGFDVDEIKHIPKIDDISVVGVPLQEVIDPFDRPDPFLKIGPIIHHQNEKICTNCAIAMSRTTRKIMFNQELRLKFEELAKKYSRIDLIQGSGWEKIPDLCTVPLLVGNCTKEFAEALNLDYCKGCPPNHNDVAAHILALLELEQ